jgi:hypothetical protein
MNDLENYLPSIYWGWEAKDLLKKPGIIAGFGVLGLGIPFIGFLFWYAVWAVLIKYLISEQKTKKIKAILQVYSTTYTEDQLNDLYKNNITEFNRLFKLSSDEFFRKYVQEQADHKKAQELIIELQKRIQSMEMRLTIMMEKQNKYNREIELLKEEIKFYEENLNIWKQAA